MLHIHILELVEKMFLLIYLLENIKKVGGYVDTHVLDLV